MKRTQTKHENCAGIQAVLKTTKNMNLMWRGLTAFFLALMIVVNFGAQLALANKARINSFLGLSSSKIVDTGEVGPTDYFKSDYAVDVNNPTAAELEALKAASKAQAIKEMEEGAVLLKNDGSALPLSKGANVSLFGHASVNPLIKANSGGAPTSGAVDIITALQGVGFNVNTKLSNYYKDAMNSGTYGSGKRADGYANGDFRLFEPNKSFYRDEVRATYEGYKDAAIVVLARSGGEHRDLPTGRDTDWFPSAAKLDASNISYLALQPKERDMLEEVKNAGFEKIIVIINSANPMELDWLDEYGVDAALWVGGPGKYGFIGMANLICGDANPSGRLVDTYASNSLSSPAMANFGNFQYTNANLLTKGTNGITDNWEYVPNYMVYAEGIYVGYKYYETRYEDVILGNGGADSTVGSSTMGKAWNYADEIVFPFGYGLSYTTFSQEIVSGSYDAKTKTFNFEVKVTNTGSVAGKNSALLYVQTPYISGGVEKSSIQLVGFGKTGILEPGKSETLKISVDKYLLASYDQYNAKGYILDAGTYYFSIGNDVHEALNYILHDKGASGMVDQNGATFRPAAENKVWSWELDKLDDTTYKYSQYNEGVEVTNRLEEYDLNYWIEDGVTYLSRSDWNNTYPKTPTVITLTQDMINELSGHYYVKPEDAPSVSDFTMGAKNGLTFANMRVIPYDDDETWNKFLDQLTLDDMIAILVDSFASPEIESVSKPFNYNNDGPDGIRGGFVKFNSDGSKQKDITGDTTCFTNEVVLASTFSYELLAERGRLLGEESLYATCPQLWSPGANLHRTPFGGRNFEYFSEDAMLSYLCLSVEVKEMQAKGVIASIKHFAGNDQESNRRGLSIFVNEQAFRQNELKAFEGGFTIGGASGTMTSYSRIGMRAFTQSEALNTDILRGEWGFKGVVISDAVKSYMNAVESVAAGTDMFCMAYNENHVKPLREAIENGDGYLLMKLREANKHYYAYSHSNLVNGLSSTMKVVSVTNWWETALQTLQTTLIILTAISAVCYISGSIHRAIIERKTDES